MHCGVFDSMTGVSGAPQAGIGGALDSMMPPLCSIRWSFGQVIGQEP